MRFNKFWIGFLLLLLAFAFGVPVYFMIGDNFFIRYSRFEKFGQAYNSKREQLGIVLLPDGWYTRDTSTVPKSRLSMLRFSTQSNGWNTQIWSSFQSHPIGSTYHMEKEIKRSLRDIDAEIDRFIKSENDTVEFMVEIKFSYLYPRDSAWSASLVMTTNTKSDYLVDSRDITIAQSDSILRKWNLK